MSILKNRIVISLVVIFLAIYFWEFWVKPVTGPDYTAAVGAYKSGQYQRSLDLLNGAYAIDPNNTAILTLMGWNDLKLGHPRKAESWFSRAHRLGPEINDTTLGYAETEIVLKHDDRAAKLLGELHLDNAEVYIAWGTLDRAMGLNREAAREFQKALAKQENNAIALQNLRELFNKPNATAQSLQFQPAARPANLTYTISTEGNYFIRKAKRAWKPVYLSGVDLGAALPGQFPVEATTDPKVYATWIQQISALGVNTIRLEAILPPAFYDALYDFNTEGGHAPLWLLQGVTFPRPPQDGDLLEADYDQACEKEIADAVDVTHGQGDVASDPLHGGGLYADDLSPWVIGFVIGNEWVSHIVIDNNKLHPDVRSYQATYFTVPDGSATEIFLAEMLNYAVSYEQVKYNWQHPVAFLNTPSLDPMTHPTESTTEEEMAIRRRMGERFLTSQGPYDDNDAVSVNPMHLRPTAALKAGYFADYNVFPFYPDFMDYDPGYLKVKDSQGSDPFYGYLLDLKAHDEGVPLLISDYGIPSSLGIGRFSPAGFNEGGLTELQQGQLLARFTQNVYNSGAAGGMVFEWLDEWYRRSWLVRNYEVPENRKPLWTNLMDPEEYYGLEAADPSGRSTHDLEGNPADWASRPLLYEAKTSAPYQPVGDAWDPARNLKALYADADDGFLYLHLVVSNLDPTHTGKVDWSKVNYLIGLGTDPEEAGLTELPFIAPVRFPMGMTFAIHLAGRKASAILIASSYDPYQVVHVAGIPSETVLGQKLNWIPRLTADGTFEPELIEPNRRRFSRAGHYFPAIRYDRGILRYGSLSLSSYDYDPLAEWHVNLKNNSIDLRIAWSLLNVTDPSSFRVFAGLGQNGVAITARTPGFVIAAFSYDPGKGAAGKPIMDQANPIADALPALSGPTTMPAGELRQFLWSGWNSPEYTLRLKGSYAVLQKEFRKLPATPPANPYHAANASGAAAQSRSLGDRVGRP